MGMIFCRGCGQQIHDSAVNCPKCGAPNAPAASSNVSSGETTVEIPDGIKGWSWGAFLLNWIWAIGNRTWIGLLALIPYVGLIMAIVLGFKGREWAWKNKQWESVEHFNTVQRKWSMWGGVIVGVVFAIGVLAAIAIPAYQDYKSRAEETVVDRSSRRVAATPATSPYPLPRLVFNQVDFIGGMKRAQMDAEWVSVFTTYLHNPADFWSHCVSSEAEIAQKFGGMVPAEAQSHGEQACHSITGQYYQCLNGKELGEAILCLQDHINNVEMNGQ